MRLLSAKIPRGGNLVKIVTGVFLFGFFIPTFFVGCASAPKPIVENPLASKSWKMSYKEKEFSFTKADLERDVLSKVHPSDEGERLKLEQLEKDSGFTFHENGILTSGKIDSCENLKAKLNNQLERTLNSPALITYTPQDNSLCKWNNNTCKANVSLSTARKEANSITRHYDLALSWQHFSSSTESRWISGGRGTADLTIGLKNENCPEAGTISADVVVADVLINNASAPPLAIVLATIEINWESAYSAPNRPVIPREIVHPFQSKSTTDSSANRPLFCGSAEWVDGLAWNKAI